MITDIYSLKIIPIYLYIFIYPHPLLVLNLALLFIYPHPHPHPHPHPYPELGAMNALMNATATCVQVSRTLKP